MLAAKEADKTRTELLKSLFDGPSKENLVTKDNSQCKMSQVFKFRNARTVGVDGHRMRIILKTQISVYDLKKIEQWILKDETFPMYIEAVQNTLQDVLKTE